MKHNDEGRGHDEGRGVRKEARVEVSRLARHPRRAVLRGGSSARGAHPGAAGHAGMLARGSMLLATVMLLGCLVPVAALASLSHGKGQGDAWPGVREYLVGNLDQRRVRTPKARGLLRMATRAIDDDGGAADLIDTGQLLYVKYTLADAGSVQGDETIDGVFSDADQASRKVWAQYETVANVYDPGDGDYYVALLDNTAVTREGRLLDSVIAERDTTGSKVTGIVVDESKGLAYLPKSIYQKDGKETFRPLAAQLLVSYDFAGGRESRVDVELSSGRLDVPCLTPRETLTCDGIDPKLEIPVVDEALAERITLADLALFVGDSERPLALQDGVNASYDNRTGKLSVSLAGVTATTLRVRILPHGIAGSVVNAIAMPRVAQAANADKLGVWPYGKLSKLDLSKIREGQAFTYKTPIKYDYDANHFADIGWANKTFWKTVGHVYTSFSNAADDNSTGSSNWVFKQMKNGTTWSAIKDYVSQTPVSASPDDVNFMIALPGDNSVGTKIGGLDWSGLTSPIKGYKGNAKYDTWIDTVAFCSHITQPGNSLTIDEAYNGKKAKVTMRILKIVRTGSNPYVIIGFCAPQVTTQSGISIIKFAVNATGSLALSKKSAEPSVTDGCAAYSLEGATFGIYSDESCTKRMAKIVTDSGGNGSAKNLAAGTYYVREDGAPRGYRKETAVRKVTVAGGKKASVSFADTPVFSAGWHLLQKRDSEFDGTAQGSATLEGGLFRVSYFPNLDGNTDGTAMREWVFATDERGRVSYENANLVEGTPFESADGKIVMPLGTYRISEERPPAGYRPNQGRWRAIVRMDADTEQATWENLDGWSGVCDEGMEKRAVCDEVVRGGVELAKVDAETSSERSLGSATLPGATFDIIYQGENPVVVAGKTCEKGDVVQTMTAVREGGGHVTARTGEDLLPVGSYRVRETGAGEGYSNGGFDESFEIAGAGMTKLAKIARNPVARGNFRFVKVDGVTQGGLVGIPFLITAKSDADGDGTRERHVLLSDENGIVSTAAGTRDNANDKALIEKDGAFSVNESALKAGSGIWFSGRTDFTSPATKGRGSLPYDTYEVRELRCKANEGRKLVTFTIAIRDDDTTVDRGTVTDAPGPALATRLLGTSGSHVTSSEDHALVDTVSYENLDRGRRYELEGTLHLRNEDGTDGGVLRDCNGNAITSIKTFTPLLASGSENISFKLDLSELGGKNVVAYETLKCEGETVATHASISDEEQTVGIASIKTSASVEGSHVANARKSVSVCDTVSYEGLIPGRKYTLVGRLLDASSKTEVSCADGSSEARSTFVPEGTSGTTKVIFQFDARKLAGHQVVATEKLYLGSTLLATHEDMDDESQTISFAKLDTKLVTDAGSKIFQPSEKTTLEDTVSYEELLPGKPYVLEGTLVDGTDGHPILDANGTAIRNRHEFTATKESGSEVVRFTLPTGSSASSSVSCVERLLDPDGRELAVHGGAGNESQTVRHPAISTTLTADNTHSHLTCAEKDASLVDLISYEGLIPGHEYMLTGRLVDANTKRPLTLKGAAATTAFVPKTNSGTTHVRFTLDARDLAGRTVVAFEELSDGSETIAWHEELHDQAQTIRFPKIATRLSDSATHAHSTSVGSHIRLVDAIEYQNLEVGKTYRLVGTLVDSDTGKPALQHDGTPITNAIEFQAKTESGTEFIDFELDGTGLEGKTLVAFEQLMHEGDVVALHEDLRSQEQSVSFHEGEAPKDRLPITGERGHAVIALIAAGLALLLLRKRIGWGDDR